MTTKIETTIKIDSWDEKPTQSTTTAPRSRTRSSGSPRATTVSAPGTWSPVLYYAADGTSTYAGVIHLDAELDGRAGSFTAISEGGYDGTTASSTMRIVEGSGELAGIAGTVSSSSTHEDYPNMPLVIAYDLG